VPNLQKAPIGKCAPRVDSCAPCRCVRAECRCVRAECRFVRAECRFVRAECRFVRAVCRCVRAVCRLVLELLVQDRGQAAFWDLSPQSTGANRSTPRPQLPRIAPLLRPQLERIAPAPGQFFPIRAHESTQGAHESTRGDGAPTPVCGHTDGGSRAMPFPLCRVSRLSGIARGCPTCRSSEMVPR